MTSILSKLPAATLSAALLATSMLALAPSAALAVPPGGYGDLVEAVSPAVVFIEVEGKAQRTASPLPENMPEELRRRFEDILSLIHI